MRIAPLAVALLLLAAPAVPAADGDADVVVRTWLVLPQVDVLARRPLRPDAVFAKHLLDRASAPPKDGDEIVGTLGKPAKWASRVADEDGDVDAAGVGWAYASVESAGDQVVLAKLEGAAVLFVGGAGFTGDVYRLGDAGVPVALKKGANNVFVAGPRGGFRLTIRPVDELQRCGADVLRSVSPDRLEGSTDDGPLTLRFWNLTDRPFPLGTEPSIAPLGYWTWISGGITPATRLPKQTPLVLGGESPKPRPVPGEPYRRTFISNIDGSVQSYAVVPPIPGASKDAPIGLVLSLHGAGVECMDQAKAYAPKPDFWIVCPTNRGRFGFDWQDWGRLDAYEVLADALKVTGVDPRRVYLTGHSMGGHGTWHLAANDPGRFLAIAPSAGWSGFDSYGGSQVMSPLAWMWRAADGASRTLDLVGNLAQIPTYVLHGEKDDNVPLSEAQLMVDAVTKAGGKPEFHVEPGAGHWWDKDEKRPGADCVDWPGIWELFRKAERRPSYPDQRDTDSLVTMDPAVLELSGEIRVWQPIEYGRCSRVDAKWIGDTCHVTTENVRMLRFGYLALCNFEGKRFVSLDGQRLDYEDHNFTRIDGRWTATRIDLTVKLGPRRSGPFKRAFTNRFVLVYGTAGDDAENRELLEKARCDSEIWAYRANGDANLMSDAQFLAGDFAERNVIVYGNADTNRAWSAVFDNDCPIVAKRGSITVGGTKHEGVVAAVFVRPRKGTDVALAAAFADTGAAATRLFYCFPVFGSGFGIPDYVVFGPGFLKEMDGDVRAAGWFDYAWRLR